MSDRRLEGSCLIFGLRDRVLEVLFAEDKTQWGGPGLEVEVGTVLGSNKTSNWK